MFEQQGTWRSGNMQNGVLFFQLCTVCRCETLTGWNGDLLLLLVYFNIEKVSGNKWMITMGSARWNVGRCDVTEQPSSYKHCRVINIMASIVLQIVNVSLTWPCGQIARPYQVWPWWWNKLSSLLKKSIISIKLYTEVEFWLETW